MSDQPIPLDTLQQDEDSRISYCPLNEDQDEIRLINILPRTAESSFIHCTLETVSLKSITQEYEGFLYTSSSEGRQQVIEWTNIHSPQSTNVEGENSRDSKHTLHKSSNRFTWGDYAALSYVWGDASMTRAIIINGRKVEVGKNLEIALRSLRMHPEFEGRYKLWVDAICINQQDNQERSRQIRKMKQIYGGARGVIAWLGSAYEDSNKAMDLIEIMNDARESDMGESFKDMLAQNPDDVDRKGWVALERLMRREYWSRLWVIQEIVLGSSSLILRCGNRSICWDLFCPTIGFLFDYLWVIKDSMLWTDKPPVRWIEGQRYSTWITTGLHLIHRDLWGLSEFAAHGNRYQFGFGQLVDLASTAKSYDDRDRVYGLVAMMEPDIAQKILPDYRLSPAQVYASVAKTFICMQGNLEPIRDGNPWGGTHSPSWAADWTWNGRTRRARITKGLWGPFWRQKGKPPITQLAEPYCSAGRKPMKVVFSDDGFHLTCRGFLVDEIDGLSARELNYIDWKEESIIQPSACKNAYGNHDGVVRALYRALVADRVAEGLKASERHAAVLNLPSTFETALGQFQEMGWRWLSEQESYYFRWSGWRLTNKNFQVLGQTLDSYFCEILLHKARNSTAEYDYTESYICADRTARGRRFMTTAEGYLGWAPDNMYGSDENQVRKGDKIAIIFGCSVPIVIRPLGNYFQVLGEAYVQGFMDEEALQFLESGKFQERDFTFV